MKKSPVESFGEAVGSCIALVVFIAIAATCVAGFTAVYRVALKAMLNLVGAE